MERTVTILGGAVLAILIAFAGYRTWSNPVAARRNALETQLGAIRPTEVKFDKPNWDFDKWQEQIAGKPGLWKELIEPPPAPAPPPAKAPDLHELLKGVAPKRQGIGNKAKIITGADAKGTFLTVGDTVNGTTIKQVTKASVVFSMMWQGKELTLELPRD